MQKSELRIQPHSVIPNCNVFEVWHNGEFIATVTGADGPGVRVISEHKMEPDPHSVSMGRINAIGIIIKTTP